MYNSFPAMRIRLGADCWSCPGALTRPGVLDIVVFACRPPSLLSPIQVSRNSVRVTALSWGFVMAGGREALLRQHIARDRVWRHLDARGQPLGRLAVAAASLLLGKHKPTALTSVWAGDPVLITHADSVVLTGRKATSKVYYRHSGYPGGLSTTPFADLQRKQPGESIRRAVRGMLPGNALRAVRMGQLYVVPGGDHPYAARKPVTMPPPAGGARLGRGGGASAEEVREWWANLLVDVGASDVRRIVAEVKAEAAGSGADGGAPSAVATAAGEVNRRGPRGLAELLAPAVDAADAEDALALQTWLQEAEASLSRGGGGARAFESDTGGRP